MRKQGAIVIIDDDPDDFLIASEAIDELSLSNKLLSFSNCEYALRYFNDLKDDDPFLILAEINIQPKNGIEMKREMNKIAALQRKFIPFIFYTSLSNTRIINEAFETQIQGFFLKKNRPREILDSFKTIFDYWNESKHPIDLAKLYGANLGV